MNFATPVGQWVFLALLFIASLSLVWLFGRYAHAAGLLDTPNERSSHVVETARGGGSVFVVLWTISVVGLSFYSDIDLIFVQLLLPGPLLVAFIGYLDDHKHIPVKYRIAVQLVAAGLILFVTGSYSTINLGFSHIELGLLAGTPVALFAIVWSINLFNFMDGTDGIASAEAIFVLLFGGVFLWQAGGRFLALTCWILVACVAGFLWWNWPKAKIFMGDVGSGFLGCVIAVYAIVGDKWYGVPVILWIMLYGLFFYDASITLIRRTLGGQHWHLAHREHAYQRLHHTAKWSHGKILGGAIAINTILAMTSICSYLTASYLLPIFYVVTILTITYLWVEWVCWRS